MKYERKSFSVSPGAANISQENWERTFGKKAARDAVVFDSLKVDQNGHHHDIARPKAPVSITGVWLRTHDKDSPSPSGLRAKIRETIFEVLVEIDGEWRLIQTHHVRPIDQTISHITEPAGIEKAPKDLL